VFFSLPPGILPGLLALHVGGQLGELRAVQTALARWRAVAVGLAALLVGAMLWALWGR
jgi:hypothetical protein